MVTHRPRIVTHHHHRHYWTAQLEGDGRGADYGQALAHLDNRAHTITDGPQPTWWLTTGALILLRGDCRTLDVTLEHQPVPRATHRRAAA